MSELIAGWSEGYRLFLIDGTILTSIAQEFEYEPGVNRAKCSVNKKHEPPTKGCFCGFWMYHHQHRALEQFEVELRPPKRTPGHVSGGYGDFGLEDTLRAVLGKVRGGGRARVGDDGARVSQVEIVALVTNEPERFVGVLERYHLGVIAPALTSRGWVVDTRDNEVVIETPTPRDEAETGLFLLADGVTPPEVGAHVAIEFERRDAIRWITHVGRAPKEG